MNNYSNMNYIPNDFGYYSQMPIQNNNYMNNMQAHNQVVQQKNVSNKFGLNNYNQQSVNNDLKLAEKLKVQAGSNMNFNKPNFVQKISPEDLYDVYSGYIRGNMFPDLYNTYKISKPYDIEPMNEQAELLTYVNAYCFAAHEVNLYLDTHPNDKNMVQLYEKLSNEADKATKEYENKYGPLYVNGSMGYPWSWNDSPWPWENM